MEKNYYSNRIDYIDVFRGIGILCMLLGHIFDPGNTFDKIIHVFHMPMFFIVSGYFFKPKVLSGCYLLKKTRSLIIPYIIVGLAHYVIYLLFYMNDPTMPKIEPIIRLFGNNTEGLPIAGALWFLTAIFICDLLYNLIFKLINNETIRILTVVIFFVLGYLLPRILQFRLPFAIDIAFCGLSFYEIGYLFRKMNIEGIKSKYKIILSILSFIIGLIASVINTSVNMRTSEYGNLILYFISSLGMCYSIWNISLLISKLEIIKPIINEFKYIGNNSIIYLCFNQLIILILAKALQFVSWPRWIELTLEIVATTLILHIICKIIYNSKLKIIFGK